MHVSQIILRKYMATVNHTTNASVWFEECVPHTILYGSLYVPTNRDIQEIIHCVRLLP